MSLFSKQKIGIAIASVATASFATGFIGTEHALKQQAEVEIAQPLQPALYDAAQRVLWQGDIGLTQVNRKLQLAKRQSAIAQSRYSNARTPDQADLRAPYAGKPSWSTSSHDAEVARFNRLDLAQEPVGEPLTAPIDPQIGATADVLPDASMTDSSPEQTTEQMERYTSESAEYSTSTNHRLESESDSRSLKPDFAWSGSPEFIKDYIKSSAIK